MEVLVTYDVNTLTPEGRARLRRVAKLCEGCGQRVQFSVFECTVTEVQLTRLRHRLLDVIEPGEDSLRLYRLPASRKESVEAYGIDRHLDFTEPLIL